MSDLGFLTFASPARTMTVDAARCGIAQPLEAAAGARGLPRHEALISAFIASGELLQGLADLEMEAAGHDTLGPGQRQALALTMRLAAAVRDSWRSGFREGDISLAATALASPSFDAAAQVSCRLAEGYVYYAVYPEAYLEASEELDLGGGLTVVGLRSIGAGLACMVAAATGSDAPVTLRPVGHPFDRRLSIGEELESRLLAGRRGRYAIVDEGPGLSGSSFGCVDDFLTVRGVDPGQITFMPSHGGMVGPHASPERRRRWSTGRRLWRDLDGLMASPAAGAPVEQWAADLIGPPQAPLEDVSGGAWRHAAGVNAPALAQFERRKFLATTASGRWLLKFIGLGAHGASAGSRAQTLADAGFTPPVAGVRHGFLVQQWAARCGQDPMVDRAGMVDFLCRYLPFRAVAFPAPAESGAGLETLGDMAAHHAELIFGAAASANCRRRAVGLARRSRPPRPVHVDSRMHAWEWLVGDRLWKLDAIDHSTGHDLIGCQDILWDVAGAELELGLQPSEVEPILHALGAGPEDQPLLDLYRLCYPAFQYGWWSLDDQGAAATKALLDRYAAAFERALAV